MPRRPRAHQLEDESRIQFQQILPSEWVFREKSNDYGIDGEVEIFDEEGMSTGLIFFVQLKGTDESELEKALQCRFMNKVIDYYKSLPVPVLLARYHSPSKNFYTKWATRVDFYYSRKNSKSVNVKYLENEKWTDDTPNLIRDSIELIRTQKD